MPAVAIVVPFIAEVVAPSVAATITSVVGGTITAAAGALGVDAALAGTIGTVGATAALKGAESAATAAFTGQDIVKSAEGGALLSAVTPALESVVAPQVSSVLGDVGKTKLAEATGQTILGATTVADVATGSILGAGKAAATAYVQGGDVIKAAEAGAVGGAVSPVVQSTLNQILDVGAPTDQIGPQQPTGTQAAITGGLTPLAAQTISGVATGQRPEDAFKAAIPSAISGGLSGAARYGLGLDKGTAGAIGQFGGALEKYLTQPSPSQQQFYGTADTITPAYQYSRGGSVLAGGGGGGGGAAPAGGGAGTPSSGLTAGQVLAGGSLPTITGPSPFLAASLSNAPSLGYTPGETVFGVSEPTGTRSKVWNVASLRNVGEETV
jgi:hypothetical protein